MQSQPLSKSSMNTASLRTYIYKSLILGLVPVMAIASLPSVGLTAPAKARKPQTPARSTNIRPIDRTSIPQGAFADSYTLGPGDRLRVDIFNVPEYSGEFSILADGTINLPVVGAVPIQGQTIQRASSALTGYFSRYVKRPLVTISLLAPRPVQVAIAGEISRAGSYTVPFTLENRKFPTISQIIQLAGGTNQTANLRQVQVRRASTGRVVSVNIFDVLQRGNTAQDISLRDGDTIFIPRSENVSSADLLRVSGSNLANQDAAIKVAVVGEVGKPGTYTLRGESSPSGGSAAIGARVSPPTLTEAIKIAGGSTASADLTKIRVRRNTRTGPGQTLPINLLSLLQSGDFSQDIVLQDGDTIVLPTSSGVSTANSSLIAASNLGPQSISPVKVVVVGEVNRPGTYTVQGAANTTNNNTQLTGTVALPTVTQAIQAAAGIKPTADIRQIQLIRTTRSGEQKIALNLFKLLQQGDTNQDIILQEGDRIFIPLATNTSPQDVDLISSSTFSPATIRVNVIGEVATRAGRAGTVEVPPNTTLNQALLIAGGFDNVRANKSEVDFIRLNPNGTVTKRMIKLNFAKGIDPEINPRLQNNDTIVVGRSNLTRIGDGFSSILSPFTGLFSIFNILR